MQNKKVAILMTGHVRTYPSNYNSFLVNVLEKYDCDLFLTTWNNIDFDKNEYWPIDDWKRYFLTYGGPYVKLLEVNDFNGFMDRNLEVIRNSDVPIGMYEKEPLKFRDGIVSEEWINRISSQWFLISRAFKNFETYCNENNKHYDVIFRTRFDTFFITPLNFKNTDADVFVPNPHPYEHLYDARDHMWYGNMKMIPLMKDMHQRSYETLRRYRNFTSELMFFYNLNDPEYHLNVQIDRDICEYQNYLLRK